MLIVKVALAKAEEFDSVVIYSRDTEVFVALSHHLDSDIQENGIMETKKGWVSISEIAELLRSEM